jgi:hypothetical protein
LPGEFLFRVEAFDRLHQPDIAFRDHFGDRQAIAAVAHGNFRYEPQMAGEGPRTSMIVDPPNGRVPPQTPAAQRLMVRKAVL